MKEQYVMCKMCSQTIGSNMKNCPYCSYPLKEDKKNDKNNN